MSEKCGKCKMEFTSGDLPAKCVDCMSTFHPACTRLGSAQNLTKNKIKSWKCDGCESGAVKASDSVTIINKSFFDAINSLKSDINSNTDSKITSVMESINSLKEDFQKFEGRLSALEMKSNELDQRCSTWEQDNKKTNEQVRELRHQLRDSEQHSRCANIEINGLPRTAEENIYSVLDKISRVIGVPYKRDDVSLAHRLRMYSQKHVHAPVIVQFVSRSVRELWLNAAKRKKGFKASDLAPSLPPSTIYINEQLTPHNKALLGRARRLQRQGKLHYAGFFNGKVLVKPSEKDAAIRVLELEDLEKYE